VVAALRITNSKMDAPMFLMPASWNIGFVRTGCAVRHDTHDVSAVSSTGCNNTDNSSLLLLYFNIVAMAGTGPEAC
jgi:hypothetical protein